jgi:hypothetical protein
MQQEVHLAPFGADPFEGCLQLARDAHVTGQKQVAAERVGNGADMGLSFFVQVGCCETGYCGSEGARASGGDARFVGNTDDKATLAVETRAAEYSLGATENSMR